MFRDGDVHVVKVGGALGDQEVIASAAALAWSIVDRDVRVVIGAQEESEIKHTLNLCNS